jgi:putative methyltransferase
MALVLVYDFLFGRGLQVGGQLKQVINRNKTSLQAALARMKVKAKVVKNEDLLPPHVQDQQGGREKNFIPTQFRHCWVYIY